MDDVKQNGFFRTSSYHKASFLLTGNWLEFAGTELGPRGKVYWLFRDPQHQGESLTLLFERGAELPAKSLLEMSVIVRRQMRERLTETNIQQKTPGKPDDDEPHEPTRL